MLDSTLCKPIDCQLYDSFTLSGVGNFWFWTIYNRTNCLGFLPQTYSHSIYIGELVKTTYFKMKSLEQLWTFGGRYEKMFQRIDYTYHPMTKWYSIFEKIFQCVHTIQPSVKLLGSKRSQTRSRGLKRVNRPQLVSDRLCVNLAVFAWTLVDPVDTGSTMWVYESTMNRKNGRCCWGYLRRTPGTEEVGSGLRSKDLVREFWGIWSWSYRISSRIPN
jgi:hypothetical protein